MNTPQTPPMLTHTEAMTLQAFITQIDTWRYIYPDKASTIEIIYYPEDDGFDVASGEPNNGVLKRNRTTAFRAQILAWATGQLNDLKGWNNDKTVTAFSCIYKDNKYGVAVAVTDRSAQDDEDAPAADVINDDTAVSDA